MERKLRYLEKEIKKDDIIVLDNGENPEAPQPKEMIDLEVNIFNIFLLAIYKVVYFFYILKFFLYFDKS